MSRQVATFKPRGNAGIGLRMTAQASLDWTPKILPMADQGVSYSTTVTFIGLFVAPFTLTGGPGWMTITSQDSTTATVGGTPDTSGNFEYDFSDSTP